MSNEEKQLIAWGAQIEVSCILQDSVVQPGLHFPFSSFFLFFPFFSIGYFLAFIGRVFGETRQIARGILRTPRLATQVCV